MKFPPSLLPNEADFWPIDLGREEGVSGGRVEWMGWMEGGGKGGGISGREREGGRRRPWDGPRIESIICYFLEVVGDCGLLSAYCGRFYRFYIVLWPRVL